LLSRIVSFFPSRIAVSFCRVPSHSFRRVSSRFFRRISHCLRHRVSSRASRGCVFAGEFLTVARIISSSFRVTFRLRLAYHSVFVSRIVPFSFHILFHFRFAYRLSFVSSSFDHKLLESSRIISILWLIIVDGLSWDSAIPRATLSSQCVYTEKNVR